MLMPISSTFRGHSGCELALAQLIGVGKQVGATKKIEEKYLTLVEEAQSTIASLKDVEVVRVGNLTENTNLLLLWIVEKVVEISELFRY